MNAIYGRCRMPALDDHVLQQGSGLTRRQRSRTGYEMEIVVGSSGEAGLTTEGRTKAGCRSDLRSGETPSKTRWPGQVTSGLAGIVLDDIDKIVIDLGVKRRDHRRRLLIRLSSSSSEIAISGLLFSSSLRRSASATPSSSPPGNGGSERSNLTISSPRASVSRLNANSSASAMTDIRAPSDKYSMYRKSQTMLFPTVRLTPAGKLLLEITTAVPIGKRTNE